LGVEIRSIFQHRAAANTDGLPPSTLRGVSIVVLEQPTESFAAFDLPGNTAHVFIRGNDLVIQALIITIMMVVSQIFFDRFAKRLFAEEMMREQFGKDYEDYMAETGRIFPPVIGRTHSSE
jgi:hypothetical protein